MNRKQLAILAVVCGLIVAALFMYFFKDRFGKIAVILIGAAVGMVVAEVTNLNGRKLN